MPRDVNYAVAVSDEDSSEAVGARKLEEVLIKYVGSNTPRRLYNDRNRMDTLLVIRVVSMRFKQTSTASWVLPLLTALRGRSSLRACTMSRRSGCQICLRSLVLSFSNCPHNAFSASTHYLRFILLCP